MTLEIVELRKNGAFGGTYLSTEQTYKYKHSENDVLDTWEWLTSQRFHEFKHTHGHGVWSIELREDGRLLGTYTVEQAAARCGSTIVPFGVDTYR